MVEITYQMVLSTLQTVGLLVGIYYYVIDLRYNRRNQEISLRNQEQTLKTRHATIYHQIMGPVLSFTGVKNILLLDANPVSSHEEWRELIRSNHECFEAWSWLCSQYEMGGTYLREGIADIGFFAGHHSYWNLRFWRQAKPIIYNVRERVGPSYYRNMEYMFDSLEKYWKEHPELAP